MVLQSSGAGACLFGQEATHDGNRKGDTDGDTREAPRIAEQQRALDEDVRAPVKTDTNTNTEDIDQSYEAAATAAGRPGARRDSGSSEGRPNHAGGDDGNKPKASVLSTSEGERAPHDTAGAAGGSPRGRSRSRRRPRISVGSESGGGAIAEAGKRSGWDAWISGERGGRGGPSSDRGIVGEEGEGDGEEYVPEEEEADDEATLEAEVRAGYWGFRFF